jgi:hypothetical protein
VSVLQQGRLNAMPQGYFNVLRFISIQIIIVQTTLLAIVWGKWLACVDGNHFLGTARFILF